MKLGYTTDDSKPTAIALSGGAGYAWLTSDNGTACYDGKPARKSRFRWRNDAVPAIAHTVALTLTLAAATPVGICAVLGLANVPAGVQVKVFGKRAGDAGPTWDFGGQNTATVVQFADGTFGAWFVLPDGAAAVTQVAFTFYNNNAGATWATAATTVDVGELVALPAVEIPIDKGWTQQLVDPSARSMTRGSQVAVDPRTPYRLLQCAFSPSPAGEAPVRFGGLANGMDWDKVGAAVAGGGRCVVIPRSAAADRINATAQYGICSSVGATQHLTGPLWRKEMAFQELPAS
jgi:hypothetical protein